MASEPATVRKLESDVSNGRQGPKAHLQPTVNGGSQRVLRKPLPLSSCGILILSRIKTMLDFCFKERVF
jgi:hypothetical protein